MKSDMLRNELIKSSLLICSLAAFVFPSLLHSQTFNVTGNVSTGATPVSHANVTFINQRDRGKRFSVITDDAGNYQISLVTRVEEEQPSLPVALELAQNYPNPFSASTAILYRLDKRSEVRITIHDILGRKVKTLHASGQEPGSHYVVWDGTNDIGNTVAQGVYFYRLQAGNETQVKKMVFTGGSAAVGVSRLEAFSSETRVPDKERVASLFEGGTYNIEIKNGDGAKPLIMRKEVTDVVIQSDTTLNFTVLEDVIEPYWLYIGSSHSYILVYDTERHMLVDSIGGFDHSVWDMVAAKSKEKLYVCTREGPVNYPGYVYSVDLRSKEKKVVLSKSSNVYISPSGNPFIVASEPHNAFRHVGIVDTLDDTIAWIDTLNILDTGHNDQGLVFDPHSTRFYSLTNERKLFKYDYETKQILQTYADYGLPRMVIDHAGKYIYFAGGPVLDVEGDSLVGWLGGFQFGTLALSPDGEYLYLTDPYIGPGDEAPLGKVRIFHTPTLSTVAYFDLIFDGIPRGTDRIVITNDGKKAYVSDGVKTIFVLDLDLRTISDIIEFRRTAFQANRLILLPKQK